MVRTRRSAGLNVVASVAKSENDKIPVRAKATAITKAAVVSTTPQKKSRAVSANDITNNKKMNGSPKKSPTRSPKPPPPRSKMIGDRRRLFSLCDDDDVDDELLEATLVSRPSKRNRSPYVGDIRFNDDNNDNKATVYPLAHLPNLDMGGKCRPGVRLLVKPSRDRKGGKIPSDATGKYGTPKCQYSCQLLWVDESADGLVLPKAKTKDDGQHVSTDSADAIPASSETMYPPVWVGAHPSLGERIAEVWLREGLVDGIPPVTYLERQITHPAGADMRADFCVHHADGSRRIVEIKTVVDTDYAVTHLPQHDNAKCVFTSSQTPYHRTAIFPWGSSNQKGPDGERVVSARAIHHVRELTKLAQGKLREEDPEGECWDGTYQATLLFVVIRGDAQAFRPNREACPSFAKYLGQAKDEGVQVLAKRVSWGTTKDELGSCFDDKMLPIHW